MSKSSAIVGLRNLTVLDELEIFQIFDIAKGFQVEFLIFCLREEPSSVSSVRVAGALKPDGR